MIIKQKTVECICLLADSLHIIDSNNKPVLQTFRLGACYLKIISTKPAQIMYLIKGYNRYIHIFLK